MVQFFKIHPENPQRRLISQTRLILARSGVIVYPTDTAYGLGCAIGNRKGVERILRIKQLPPSHHFSILCPDLSEISRYARVDNRIYRTLKRCLPGPFTFVLEATREVPKTLIPRRKTIGLRIPANPICLALLSSFGAPLLSTSLRLPGMDTILSDPEDMRQQLGDQVDLIIDGGILPANPSTVVDLTGDTPVVLRAGAGTADKCR